MASSIIIFSFLILSIISSSSSLAQQSSRPKALILPITKDKLTLQYTTIINQRTPLVPASLVFDLGGRSLWVDCAKNYVSTTYKPARCKSALCKSVESFGCESCLSPPRPGCNNNTCGLYPDNSVTQTGSFGDISFDAVSIQSTNGYNPGPVVKIPNLIFVCGSTFLLKGLAKGTVGMAGMGRDIVVGLPSQFATTFSFSRKFAVCLTSGRGVAFFGNGPYVFLPGIQISALATTPLLINPITTAAKGLAQDNSSEYFIGVTAIKIAEKTIHFDKNLLEILSNGYGGTKISTVHPYTKMETTIFEAFTKAFTKEAAKMNITRVASVKPFGACFSTQNIAVTRLGYAVPEIQLVLHSKKVVWRIFGANSMVKVSDDVICLGFVDAKRNDRTSIVIGGHQLEDNLIEIDLARNTFGFSSTLLGRSTSCANFNFTATA